MKRWNNIKNGAYHLGGIIHPVNVRKYLAQGMRSERGEFGMSSIIGIAIGLIIAAFILIPGIQTFANKIISDMQLWWTNSISAQIFPN